MGFSWFLNDFKGFILYIFLPYFTEVNKQFQKYLKLQTQGEGQIYSILLVRLCYFLASVVNFLLACMRNANLSGYTYIRNSKKKFLKAL